MSIKNRYKESDKKFFWILAVLLATVIFLAVKADNTLFKAPSKPATAIELGAGTNTLGDNLPSLNQASGALKDGQILDRWADEEGAYYLKVWNAQESYAIVYECDYTEWALYSIGEVY